ncbi:MAG TPA: hypothetical protein VEV85_02075, partial [Bryobacteraceae bacterium]|nr:hypothetical protein [Bryobacteraceae bacterium]
FFYGCRPVRHEFIGRNKKVGFKPTLVSDPGFSIHLPAEMSLGGPSLRKCSNEQSQFPLLFSTDYLDAI